MSDLPLGVSAARALLLEIYFDEICRVYAGKHLVWWLHACDLGVAHVNLNIIVADIMQNNHFGVHTQPYSPTTPVTSVTEKLYLHAKLAE